MITVFSNNTSYLLDTQSSVQEGRDGERNEVLIIHEVSDLLYHLGTQKPMRLDGIHPRVLREQVEVLTKTLSIIYQQSCLTVEVAGDWSLANVCPFTRSARRRTQRTTHLT